MSDHSSFQPPSGPPSEPPFGAPSGTPLDPPGPPPGPVSPISPERSPWKPAALGFGAAVVLGAGVFGVVQLTGDDDTIDTSDLPPITVPSEVEQALDDAQNQADQLVEDVLGSVPSVPAVPVVPHGEPGGQHRDTVAPPASTVAAETEADDGTAPVTTTADVESDGPVTITVPDIAFGQLGECLGLGDLFGDFDLDELGDFDLDDLPVFSIPDFSIPDLSIPGLSEIPLDDLDLGELLEEIFGQLGADLPAGSLPFDPEQFSEMSPAEIEEFFEEQFGDLGELGDLGEFGSLPPISIPGLPSLPTFDPDQLEECFGDLAP